MLLISMCSFRLYGPRVVYPIINRLVPAPLDLKQGNVRESGFRNEELFVVESGILGFGIWNTAQGIRNPNNDWNFSKAVVPTVENLSSKVCPGVENFSLINFLIFNFLLKHSVAYQKNKSTNLFKRFGSSKLRVVAFTEH